MNSGKQRFPDFFKYPDDQMISFFLPALHWLNQRVRNFFKNYNRPYAGWKTPKVPFQKN